MKKIIFVVFTVVLSVVSTSAKSISLNGANQYLSISDAAQTGLDIIGDISMEVWIKIEQLPSTVGASFGIITKSDNLAAATMAYDMFIKSNDVLGIHCMKSSAEKIQGYSTVVIVDSNDVGEWVHLAATVDVSTKTVLLYKNGSSVSVTYTRQTGSSMNNTSVPLFIGCLYRESTGGANNYFNGLMDDVRIWDDIRAQSEIQDNMNVELTGSEDNLAGYWKFNNNGTDETLNSNDLTLYGSPAFSYDGPIPDGYGSYVDIGSIADIDNNGSSEAVFLKVDGNGFPIVCFLDISSDQYIRNINFFDSSWVPQTLRVIPDISGNNIPEISVLAVNKTTAESQVYIRDGVTGDSVKVITLP